MNTINLVSSGIWEGSIFYDSIDRFDIGEKIDSLAVISKRTSSNIILNGEDVSMNQLGYNIVTISEDNGELIESINFNTYADEAASSRMVDFLKSQKKKTIIMGSVRWDGAKYLSDDAIEIFEELGLKKSLKDKINYCHGFITYKGIKDNGIEFINHDKVEILFLNR